MCTAPTARATGVLLPVQSNLVEPEEFIQPMRHDTPRLEPLRVKYDKIEAVVENQVATTTAEQSFVNDTGSVLEGTYVFPLPKGASISDFYLYIEGKKTKAELLDSSKARSIYEGIVSRMRDPALLEYMENDLFKARIYPIPAHGERKVELSYQHVLHYDAGTVKYVYPMNYASFCKKPLETLSMKVTVKSKLPIKAVYSPTHKIDVNRKSDGEVVVGFEEEDVIPDKDFVLYYSVTEKDFGLTLLSQKEEDENGFFMMLISPGKRFQEEEIQEKNVVFVLDTSGSMTDSDKMEKAKDALKFCLKHLKKDDHFNIIAFSTETNPLSTRLVRANKNTVNKALKFVDELEAVGGTAIDEALLAALQHEPAQDGSLSIVFITDGKPTIGVTGKDEIIKNAKKANESGARIFPLGIGTKVNTHLLDTLAAQNGGVSEYVRPDEDMEVKISNFYLKFSHPILSNIKVTATNVRLTDVYPKGKMDLFKGSQLTILGRYNKSDSAAITLAGKMGRKNIELVYEVDFPDTSDEATFIPRLWATRKVGYLLEEIRLHGEDQELKSEVVRLAKKYGIVTPYTSYLVVEDEEVIVRRDGRPPRPMASRSQIFRDGAKESLRQAPGVSGAADMDLMEYKEKAAKAESGALSVATSREISRLKRLDAPFDDRSSSLEIKHVSGRTFYRQDNSWVDSEYTGGNTDMRITFGSTAYFELLRLVPKAGPFCSLGDRVIFYYKGLWIRIDPSGRDDLSDREREKLENAK